MLRRRRNFLLLRWPLARALSTSSPLQSHLQLAKALWRLVVKPTDVVVDATAGNGFDTLELTKLTPKGHCHAIDISPLAIFNTKCRLTEALGGDLPQRCTLHEQSHARKPPGLEQCKLVVFNLGYLPGQHANRFAVDDYDSTSAESTIGALESWALPSLVHGGCASLTVYPGHPKGLCEHVALEAFAMALHPTFWRATTHRTVNHVDTAPYLLTLHRQPKAPPPKKKELSDTTDADLLLEQENLAAAASAARDAISCTSSS